MFTYEARRQELTEHFRNKPFSCTYNWVSKWITNEIAKLPPGSKVLELGTFVGGTTRILALSNPQIIVHSIDLNEFDNNNHMLEAMRMDRNLPNLVASDLLEIQRIHTEDCANIQLHTGHSRSLDINDLSISFVDASHSQDEIIQDLEYVWQRTLPNGFIYGDDVNHPNVFNAFSIFAKEKDVELTIYSKCARIQKTEKVSPGLRYMGIDDLLTAKF